MPPWAYPVTHRDVLTVACPVRSFAPSMRGRGRRISTVLADALEAHPGARPAAVAAAFAEACGHPLCREASLRALTRDGVLIAVARTAEWAAQLEAITPILCERVNARLGARLALTLQVRVGPLRE